MADTNGPSVWGSVTALVVSISKGTTTKGWPTACSTCQRMNAPPCHDTVTNEFPMQAARISSSPMKLTTRASTRSKSSRNAVAGSRMNCDSATASVIPYIWIGRKPCTCTR